MILNNRGSMASTTESPSLYTIAADGIAIEYEIPKKYPELRTMNLSQ